MKVKTKHSTTNYFSLQKWLKQELLQLYFTPLNFSTSPLSLNITTAFVCGCGHTGTTLIASRLGKHPDAFFIPRETYLFRRGQSYITIKEILKEWRCFALLANKKLILEKTPKHIHRLSAITAVLPSAKLIIVKRNPIATVASLYRRFGNLDVAIDRYRSDGRATLEATHRENSCVVAFEEFTEDPVRELRRVFNFLHLDWFDDLTNGGGAPWAGLGDEPEIDHIRSAQTRQPITKRPDSWKEILTKDQIERVYSALKDIGTQLGYNLSEAMYQ